jgi:HEAT repeat protein
VAIETYHTKRDRSLDGPAHDAIAWVSWLRDECLVPHANILVLASPLECNKGLFADLGVECRLDPDLGNEAVKDSLRWFQGKAGRLWLIWSGHGIVRERERFAFLANYREDDRNVLSIENLQDHLQTAAPRYPRDQVLVFDTCGTVFDEYEFQQTLAYQMFGKGEVNKSCRQFLMFASEDDTVAVNRQGVGGTFTAELLASLKSLNPDEPADLRNVHGRMLRRFEDLRRRDPKVQRPILYTWRAPGGDGQENIELIPKTDPALDPLPYLRAVAANLARSPFPWLLPRDGVEFFRDLHIQVRVGPQRRDPFEELERERRRRAGMPPDDHRGRPMASAYSPAADEARFPREPSALPMPWFDPNVPERSARAQLPWAVLLGDPGLGKTTLLRYEGWRAAKDAVAALEGGAARPEDLDIPIYARLADLAEPDGGGIGNALVRAATDAGQGAGIDPDALRTWLLKKLEAGRTTLLLDALDELSEEQYKDVTRRLVRWVGDHRPRQLYITSRQAGYRNLPPELKGGGGSQPELELVAFTPAEIRRYVAAFFGAEDPRAVALQAQLQANPGLLGMVQIPLLLTLACLIVAEDSEFGAPGLPTTRGDLLARCLDRLMGCWRYLRSQGYVPEAGLAETGSLRRERKLFAELAWELVGNDAEHTLFYADEVVSALDKVATRIPLDALGPTPKLALDALDRHSGILTRAGKGHGARYFFLHRTFQEYLLAWAIGRRDDWLNLLVGRLYDPAWLEPLSLLGSVWDRLVEEERENYGGGAEPCVAWLLRENANDLCCRPFLLACRIAVEGRHCLPAPLRKGLFDRLVAFSVGYCPEYVSQSIVQQARDLLRQAGSEVIGPLLNVLREKEGSVRTYAAESLGSLGQADSGVLHALFEIIREDKEWSVRQAAAEALGRLGQLAGDFPNFGDTLRHALLWDTYWPVRAAAARSLGALGQVRSDLVSALCDAIYEVREEGSVRAAAAEALGRLGQANQDIVDALRMALEDLKEPVCSAAATSLAALGQFGPEVVEPLLKNLRDETWWVRAIAAASLGTLGQANSGVIPALHNTLSDPEWLVRRAVVMALGELGQAGPDVVNVPLSALCDVNGSDRADAARVLGGLGPIPLK